MNCGLHGHNKGRSKSILCGLSVWVLSQHCGFLPQSQNNHVRLTGDSKLAVAVDMIMTVV